MNMQLSISTSNVEAYMYATDELSMDRIMFLLSRMRTIVDSQTNHLPADAGQESPEQTPAKNRVPTGLLDTLLHPDPNIREELTEFSNLAMEALMCLVHDPSADVRFALASNHNITEQVLIELAKDENPYICLRAQRTLSRRRTAERPVLLPFNPLEKKRSEKKAQYA